MSVCFSAGGKDWFLKLKLEAGRGKNITTFFKNQQMCSTVKLRLSWKVFLTAVSLCFVSKHASPLPAPPGLSLRMPTRATLTGEQGKERGCCEPCWRREAMRRIPPWHLLAALSWTPSWNACQVASSKKIYAQEQESNEFPPPRQSRCLHCFRWMTDGGLAGKVRSILPSGRR